MTATTQILPFSTAASGSGGNRLSPSAYAALTTLLADGFQAGVAQSNQVNTVLAQASFMAAGLANFCVSQGVSVPDDGNLTNLVSEITSALTALITATTPGTTLTIPSQTKTGSGYTYAAADNSYYTRRSNSGSAMADTLPGTSGALAAALYGYIKNVDTAGPVTVTVGASGTIAVGNNATANAFVVAPGETWLWISLGTGNYIAQRIAEAVLHTRPVQGSFKNLKGTWASNTGATFTADGIVLYDSNGNSKIVTSFNKTLATGTSGAGGIDTGSLATSTWYYVYAILNAATGVNNILFSANAASPTMPSGYTYVARIGSFLTDGSSNIIGFKQWGRDWWYTVGSNCAGMPLMASGNSGDPQTGPVWTAIATAGFVPSTASAIQVSMQNCAPEGWITVAPNNSYGAPLGSNPPPVGFNYGTTSFTRVNIPAKLPLESSNIYYAAINTSGGSDDLAVFCRGFTDNF